MKIQLGLKAWSINIGLIEAAQREFDNGKLDYVELFCVPGSFSQTWKKWTEASFPIIVHAPHSLTGLNFAKPEMLKQNAELVAESFNFADKLSSRFVIYHPGTDGTIEETKRQILGFYDPRMVIENKPLLGIDGTSCIGSTPGEIKFLCEDTGVMFCLDFGHAVSSANSHGKEPISMIMDFFTINPVMFHLADGDYGSELDNHFRYGEGTFPLKKIIDLLPSGALVTNEAKREQPDQIDEYLTDRLWIEQNV
jgi:sugar phosphate isomerase/epimerase